jgi:hypothetical protein
MSDWPKDWPEDRKTGLGFLAELMARYPEQVKIGRSLDEVEKFLSEEPSADKVSR